MAQTVEDNLDEPIIVKKIIKKSGHHGHHGGAWKVAYADFVTAMMCLFLLLWLVNVDPSSKSAVASFFRQPTQSGPIEGNVFIFGGAKRPASPGKFEGGASFLEFQKLILTGQNKIEVQKSMRKELQKELELASQKELLDKVEFNLVEKGILIEIKDSEKSETFRTGSSSLTEESKKIIDKLAGLLRRRVSPIVIAGHTDSREFSSGGYDNWNLSMDRAIRIKSRLIYGGINKTRFARIEGYADTQLKNPDVPLSPANRRITILLLQEGELENLKPKYMNPEDDFGAETFAEKKQESKLKQKGHLELEEYKGASAGKRTRPLTLEEMRRKKERSAWRKRHPYGTRVGEIGAHGSNHDDEESDNHGSGEHESSGGHGSEGGHGSGGHH